MATEAAASPCVSICTYERRLGYCTGCGRTLDEIAGWGRLNDGQKRTVRAAAAERLGAAPSPTL